MTELPWQVERVLLRQFHHSRDYVTGTLCLTDRHLIFIEPTGAQETWVRQKKKKKKKKNIESPQYQSTELDKVCDYFHRVSGALCIVATC